MKSKIVSVMMLFLIASLFGCGKSKDSYEKQSFQNEEALMKNEFVSWCPYSEEYLKELCDTYQLEEMTKECQSDYEKVQKISTWVSGLWEHDGRNEPLQNDPMYILDQVINHGEQYRCVEYGIVINGCLNALGLECRQLNLKTKDVETREIGAGHVGCEAFLEDYNKWVFIDGQWGAIPMAKDVPLNAYEFGEAIRKDDPDLTIHWINNVYGATDSDYFKWIEPYLYYMDSGFKNVDGGYTTVMFVPDGGKNVTKFQRKYEIHMDHYLRDEQMFYYRKEDYKRVL